MKLAALLEQRRGETREEGGPSILFVAMQDSIHTARWIELAATLKVPLHLFPLDQAALNPKLSGVTAHWPEPTMDLARALAGQAPLPKTLRSRCASVLFRIARSSLPRAIRPASHRPPLVHRIARFAYIALADPARAIRLATAKAGASAPVENTGPYPAELYVALAHDRSDQADERRHAISPADLGPAAAIVDWRVRLGESPNAAPALFGPWVLASLIRRLKPTLVHSMEFQRAGYLVLKAKEIYGPGFPSWLATNWGSDIFYFRRLEDHRAQLRRLLAAIDYYSCECHRDIGLARELGYEGPVLPVLPNSGGFDLAHVRALRSPGPSSGRKLLMIKGYDHFAGRAMTSLSVLETFADRLAGYEIVLYSVSEGPRQAAQRLVEQKALDIRIIDWATHDEMLALFGRARLYMGISISDAISTSVLEAMAMGAFPIQTDTSCCEEWFKDGEGGFIVPADDFAVICDRFRRALDDDALVDRAAEVNWATVAARLDKRLLQGEVEAFYRQIFAGGPTAARRVALAP